MLYVQLEMPKKSSEKKKRQKQKILKESEDHFSSGTSPEDLDTLMHVTQQNTTPSRLSLKSRGKLPASDDSEGDEQDEQEE